MRGEVPSLASDFSASDLDVIAPAELVAALTKPAESDAPDAPDEPDVPA